VVLRGPHRARLEGRARGLPRRPPLIPDSTEPLARWLSCPRCGERLAASGRLVLVCANGHSFDINKRGYLTTLDRSAGITGDTRAILDARAAFLASGAYSPIADLVDSLVPRQPGVAILDSGCGTGYYLHRLLHGRPDAVALALDASTDAVALTVAATGAAGLVADVWKPLPVRQGAADVVLCVFAPRNAGEFARMLAPGGRLVVVTPQHEHLHELRERGAVIGIQDDKLEKLDASLAAQFTLASRESLRYSIEVDEPGAALLAGMGPAGHHAALDRASDGYAGSVTVAVDASVYVHAAR
jgi:23S rRNA (guanine745-N1)-methyltransferase